jgi:hypothetical protein
VEEALPSQLEQEALAELSSLQESEPSDHTQREYRSWDWIRCSSGQRRKRSGTAWRVSTCGPG